MDANQGTARKWKDVTRMRNWYHMARSGKKAEVSMNMFVCQPRTLRAEGLFDVKVLERHPFTPQTFVPMGLGKNETKTFYLVIVAPTLPNTAGRGKDPGAREPPYPVPPAATPRPKRSLRERLLGTRPSPYSNTHLPDPTPAPSQSDDAPRPKGTGGPDLSNVRAFIARGDQAVTYGPGTWHAPMVVLGEQPIEFVVIQFANGTGDEDCQEVEIGEGDVAVEVGSNSGASMRAKL